MQNLISEVTSIIHSLQNALIASRLLAIPSKARWYNRRLLTGTSDNFFRTRWCRCDMAFSYCCIDIPFNGSVIFSVGDCIEGFSLTELTIPTLTLFSYPLDKFSCQNRQNCRIRAWRDLNCCDVSIPPVWVKKIRESQQTVSQNATPFRPLFVLNCQVGPVAFLKHRIRAYSLASIIVRWRADIIVNTRPSP